MVYGARGCTKLVDDCEACLLAETRCSTNERDKKFQGYCTDVCDVEMVRDLFILRLEKEQEPERWKQLHVGGIDGISCQHLQVLVTQLLRKHWEWQ